MTRFKNKKVVVMGLGLHGGGKGVAKFFSKQGAKLLITDLKTKKELKSSLQKLKGLSIEYVLGGHREKDFKEADLVIKNPDVPQDSPYLKIAKEYDVPVKSDVAIFFELCKSFIIGITGTKGKSTVATLVYKFLRTKYPNTILAGNIGLSPLEILSKINEKTKVVLELSSFELENLKESPQVAVITNILPDHLNRYKNLKEYIEAKKPIFKYQRKKDVLVLNYDDPIVRKFSSLAPSQVYFFSRKKKIPPCSTKDSKLYGKHNISNLLAAVSVAKLLKVPDRDIKKVIKSFRGVAGRQEFIGEKKGVKYFNDTTATMPEATQKAVRTMRERFPNSAIILIAGGQDKNLDYKSLVEEIKKKIDCFVLLPGTASDKIKKELGKSIKIFPVSSMKEAVKKSSDIAKKGDIVILSPAAASFNLFKNEFDRGEQFNKVVKKL